MKVSLRNLFKKTEAPLQAADPAEALSIHSFPAARRESEACEMPDCRSVKALARRTFGAGFITSGRDGEK